MQWTAMTMRPLPPRRLRCWVRQSPVRLPAPTDAEVLRAFAGIPSVLHHNGDEW